MKSKKLTSFVVRPFYDGGLIRIEDVVIPSKRVGYKLENGVHVARIPLGVREFEQLVREAYAGREIPGWPSTSRLFVAIGIQMPKKQFKVTDVDNVAKSILDSLCGIAYVDDRQIESLFVNKAVSHKRAAYVGFHTIAPDDPMAWFVEPLLRTVEEEA